MRPELVRADQISMLMPEFTENHGADEDKRLAKELLYITRETRVVLGQFFLYTAMTRSKDFADACDESRAKAGASIVVATLMRTIVVSTAAIFRGDSRAISLPKIMNAALRQDRSEFLRKLHIRNGHGRNAELSRDRLVKYQRSLKTGKIREAIDALAHVRNTFIAHFDLEPETDGRTAIVHDIDRAIKVASIVVGEANFFVLGRRILGADLRKILRNDANGFVEALQRGF